MSENFSEKLSFGQVGQDVIVNFLEKHFGYRFMAGERDGKLYNTDMIEEIEHCDFIYPSVGEGAKLKFGEDIVYCPDVFMRNNKNVFCWIEIKRRESSFPYAYVNKEHFDSYELLFTRHTRVGFSVMCLIPQDDDSPLHDIFHAPMDKMIETKGRPIKMGKTSYYRWDLTENTMEKLNRYPIDIDKYR